MGGGQQLSIALQIGRRDDALGGIQQAVGAPKFPAIDGRVYIRQEGDGQCLLGCLGAVAVGIDLQGLFDVPYRAVGFGFHEVPLLDALGGETEQTCHGVIVGGGGGRARGREFRRGRLLSRRGVHCARVSPRLGFGRRRLDLFARFGELAGQVGNAVSIDTCLAGGLDGGRRLIEAVLQ